MQTLPPAPLPSPIDFRFRTLDNGLQVVTAPRRQSPNVAIQVWYRVGGKHDPDGRAGFAHLFEHLMFKRTRNLPDEAFDRLTEDVGGENNAFTTPDVTAYHEVVPSHHLHTLLWAEAERMAHLDVTEASFRSERDVVKEEYRQSVLTPPYGRLDDALERLSWTRHPYRRPVIGNIPELDAASLDDALAFHRAHYRPDNAVLVVVGDFDPRACDAWIDATFGRIPRPDIPLAPFDGVEPPRTRERRADERAPNVPLPALALSFLTPSVRDADAPALRILDAVLASGQSSRLHQSLVYRQQVASQAYSYLDLRADAGLLVVRAVAAEGKDAATLEKAILDELARLQSESVPAAELARVRDRIVTDTLRARESAAGIANALGEATALHGTPEPANTELPRLMAVTAADVRRVAQRTLTAANRLVVRYGPGPAAPAEGRAAAPPPPPVPAPAPHPVETPPRPSAPRPFALPAPRETLLRNGVRVAAAAQPGSGLVSLHVAIDHGAASDRPGHRGQANFVASLLPRGTLHRSAEQIAAEAEALGGEISAGADWDAMILSLTVPRTRSAAALALLADLARNPALTAAEADRLRAELRADLAVRLQEPGTLAAAVANRLLYADTPYAGLLTGTFRSLGRIATIDARDFHAATFRPANALVAVTGDIAPGDAFAQVEAAFGTWEASRTRTPLPRPRLSVPPVVRRVVLVDLPDAGQAAVVVARPGLARADHAWPAALLANSLLGGGFSSRLSQEVRIRRGLAYGAFSALSGRAGVGPLTLSAQTRNDAAARVAGLMCATLERLPLDPIPPEELAARKASLTGPMTRQLETAEGLGASVIRTALLRLPLTEIAALPGRIEALGAEEVRDVARRRLGARYASVVVVGDARRCRAALRERFGAVRVIPASRLDLDSVSLSAAAGRGRR